VTTPAAVRLELAAALEPVLPGRVQTFPPTTRRWAAPLIFIDQVSITPVAAQIVATFPVWCVVDGTVDAQIAIHDDLVWNTFLAVYPYADTVAVRTQQLALWRASTVDVDVVLEVSTLTGTPPPQIVTVPPAPPVRHATI
jgi:hypothetical protein